MFEHGGGAKSSGASEKVLTKRQPLASWSGIG
jgi:hypothetical protein